MYDSVKAKKVQKKPIDYFFLLCYDYIRSMKGENHYEEVQQANKYHSKTNGRQLQVNVR